MDLGKATSYKEFVFFDELYEKHQELKRKYLDLYNNKFSDFENSLSTIKTQSQNCEKESNFLIQSLRSEVKKWRGDREFTSIELSEKLKEMEKRHNETLDHLENANKTIEEKNKQIDLKSGELENAFGKILSLKNNLETKHRETIRKIENDFLKKILSHKTEIKTLKVAIDSINEENQQRAKVFSGTLAENESKWAEEKIRMQQKIREMLDEVAHWNKEALKMENRVRQYEKKLMAVGVSLEYNREETKETEKQQEILINERNNLKIQCEDKDYLIRKYEKRENELMEQISDLKNKTEKNQNGKKFKNFEKLCECFTLMCGMKIEEIEKYFENESIRHFRCKSVNYKNTKMLEFEMKIDLSTNKANFEPLRLVDPANVLPDELKHKIEFDIFQLPLFLSKVLSVVNSE